MEKKTIETIFPNGMLQSQFEVVIDKGKKQIREGNCEEWYEDGKLKGKSIYKNGRLDGLATNWDRNGDKSSEIEFSMGQFKGVVWAKDSTTKRILEEYYVYHHA